MECPRPIYMSILSHMVVANQALHEDTKVRGPGVEAIATVCDTWVGVTMV